MNFKKSLIASLLLHLFVLGGVWELLHTQWPRYQKREMLVIEIDGALSDRQKEVTVLRQSQAKSAGAPQQKQIPAMPQPVQKVEKKEQQKKQEKSKQEKPKDASALKQAKPEKAKEHKIPEANVPKPLQPSPSPPPQEGSPPRIARENAAESNRQSRQETIKHEKVDVSALKRYLARLKKALQPHIVYPDAAKNLQFFGNPTVRFSIDADGHVDPGSVSVVKSSQHAILDEFAIKAVLASSPLPKPPKPLTLQVEVAFSVQ